MSNESLLARIPRNTSFLQETKFTFTFPNMPFLNYFCQTVNIPEISTSAVTVSSPFANMYRHGDKLVYGDLTITALIDEDLRVWEETRNWLMALTKPEDFNQYERYRNPEGKLYHDGILTVNTNSNNTNMRFKFFHCHPVSLSSVQFNVSGNADTVLTADIIFRYDIYQLERL